MFYEELHDGAWRRIEIDGEMLMGRAHHVIYFASPERWASYPEWARHRRDEIVARVKSELRAPDYEYGDGATAAGSNSDAPAAPSGAGPCRMSRGRTDRGRRGSEMRALYVAIVLLLVTAGAMAWLVVDGVAGGQTFLPARGVHLWRTVVRVHEPATFWMCIATYAAVGLGALGLGVWGLREGRKLRTPGPRRG